MTNFTADYISSLSVAMGEGSNRSYVDKLLGICTDNWNSSMIELIAPRISQRVVFRNPFIEFFERRVLRSSQPRRLY